MEDQVEHQSLNVNKAAHVHDMTINFPVPILFKTDVYVNFTTEHVYSYNCFS